MPIMRPKFQPSCVLISFFDRKLNFPFNFPSHIKPQLFLPRYVDTGSHYLEHNPC